jgi:hypothetical protein
MTSQQTSETLSRYPAATAYDAADGAAMCARARAQRQIEEARDARVRDGDSLASIIGCGLGLIAESIPRGSFRNAINAGLPLLTGCEGVAGDVETGDDLEINFNTGEFKNLSRDITRQFQPLDAQLQAIIEAGGWHANLKKRIAKLRSGESAVA